MLKLMTPAFGEERETTRPTPFPLLFRRSQTAITDYKIGRTRHRQEPEGAEEVKWVIGTEERSVENEPF